MMPNLFLLLLSCFGLKLHRHPLVVVGGGGIRGLGRRGAGAHPEVGKEEGGLFESLNP
jgi:hypothetical protein